MKKFAAFLMILSVSVFTMGCSGGKAKSKKTGGDTTAIPTPPTTADPATTPPTTAPTTTPATTTPK